MAKDHSIPASSSGARQTPDAVSLYDRTEQADFDKKRGTRKRVRSQVGRNVEDRGKLQAIKQHFGNIDDDVMYGISRGGKNLWQRVGVLEHFGEGVASPNVHPLDKVS